VDHGYGFSGAADGPGAAPDRPARGPSPASAGLLC